MGNQGSRTPQHVSPSQAPARKPVITSNLETPHPPCSLDPYTNVGSISTMSSAPLTTSSIHSTLSIGRPTDSSVLMSNPNHVSMIGQNLPHPGYQGVHPGVGTLPHLHRAQSQIQQSTLPHTGQSRPNYTPVSSTPSTLNSGLQRSGESVITSKTSNTLPQPVSSPLSCPHPPAHIKANSVLQPMPSRSYNSATTQSSSSISQTTTTVPTPVYPGSCLQPSAPSSQSIADALNKLDAELQGHMQAEERKRHQEEKRKHIVEPHEVNTKKHCESAIRSLERLLSGSRTEPPPSSFVSSQCTLFHLAF